MSPILQSKLQNSYSKWPHILYFYGTSFELLWAPKCKYSGKNDCRSRINQSNRLSSGCSLLSKVGWRVGFKFRQIKPIILWEDNNGRLSLASRATMKSEASTLRFASGWLAIMLIVGSWIHDTLVPKTSSVVDLGSILSNQNTRRDWPIDTWCALHFLVTRKKVSRTHMCFHNYRVWRSQCLIQWQELNKLESVNRFIQSGLWPTPLPNRSIVRRKTPDANRDLNKPHEAYFAKYKRFSRTGLPKPTAIAPLPFLTCITSWKVGFQLRARIIWVPSSAKVLIFSHVAHYQL